MSENKEIKILWEKEKPNAEEIEKLVRDNDVIIYGAPIEFAEKLMRNLNGYVWKIKEDIGDEEPMGAIIYWQYRDNLVKGLSTVHEIYISQLKTECDYCTLAFIYLRGWD